MICGDSDGFASWSPVGDLCDSRACGAQNLREFVLSEHTLCSSVTVSKPSDLSARFPYP